MWRLRQVSAGNGSGSGIAGGVPTAEQGLEDRPSTPVNMPKLLSEDIGDIIEEMRRGKKFGPARISGELALLDIKVSTATVHRELVRRGINKLRTTRGQMVLDLTHDTNLS